VNASAVIAILAAVGTAIVGAKGAGDWLANYQDERRQRDRDEDLIHGYTDGRGERHLGVAERQDECDEWRAEYDEWRHDIDRQLGTPAQ
jgi:hypothetical protein